MENGVVYSILPTFAQDGRGILWLNVNKQTAKEWTFPYRLAELAITAEEYTARGGAKELYLEGQEYATASALARPAKLPILFMEGSRREGATLYTVVFSPRMKGELPESFRSQDATATR